MTAWEDISELAAAGSSGRRWPPLQAT